MVVSRRCTVAIRTYSSLTYTNRNNIIEYQLLRNFFLTQESALLTPSPLYANQTLISFLNLFVYVYILLIFTYNLNFLLKSEARELFPFLPTIINLRFERNYCIAEDRIHKVNPKF